MAIAGAASCKRKRRRRPSVTMRDQHRGKQELCDEVAALRKQVADLKAEALARRRVEDALRLSEEQLRLLTDSAPAGLCVIRSGGSVRAANRPFARLLGYDTPAELQRIGEVLGVVAGREELDRVVELAQRGDQSWAEVLFRRKDGTRASYGVIGVPCEGEDAVALVALERPGLGVTPSGDIPSSG